MTDIKELKDEELNKVSGGSPEGYSGRFVQGEEVVDSAGWVYTIDRQFSWNYDKNCPNYIVIIKYLPKGYSGTWTVGSSMLIAETSLSVHTPEY